jgi:hypothetical protein
MLKTLQISTEVLLASAENQRGYKTKAKKFFGNMIGLLPDNSNQLIDIYIEQCFTLNMAQERFLKPGSCRKT